MYLRYKLISFLFILSSMAMGKGEQKFLLASVGAAKEALVKVQVNDPNFGRGVSSQAKKVARQAVGLMADNFGYYLHKYKVLKSKGHSFESRPVKALTSKGVDILIQSLVEKKGRGHSLSINVFNVISRKTIYSLSLTLPLKNWRQRIHGLSDKVYRRLNNGKKSIFNDKIIFVSNHGSSGTKQYKEIYQVDFDGQERKRLTFHEGVVISPSVSADGRKILYSLIDEKARKRNINLMMLNLDTGKVSLISDKKGINSGAVFTGDGKSILLTLSFNGNADIYEMHLSTKRLVQITKSFAADVDPSINGRGTQMSFLSDRSGRAMIYSLNLTRPGAKPSRITYVGKFNATPRYSPDGEDIVFSSWLDKRFDIFRIKSTGQQLVRLTKDFGSNEEPSFSLDNEFIVFTSRRVLSSREVKDSIYLMTRDGEIIREIVKNFGICTTPRWLSVKN